MKSWQTVLVYLVAIAAVFFAGWFARKGCAGERTEHTSSIDTIRVSADTVVQTATITVIRRVPVYREVPGATELVPTPCPEFIATLDTVLSRTATVASPQGVVDVPFDESIHTEFNSATQQQTVIVSNPPILWVDSLTTTVQEITEGHGFWTDLGIWAVGVVVGALGALALLWAGAK